MKALINIVLFNFSIFISPSIMAVNDYFINDEQHRAKIISLKETNNTKIKRAWIKTEFKVSGDESRVLYEIECKKETYKTLGGVFYNKQNAVNLEPTTEKYIVPDTNVDSIKIKLCKE